MTNDSYVNYFVNNINSELGLNQKVGKKEPGFSGWLPFSVPRDPEGGNIPCGRATTQGRPCFIIQLLRHNVFMVYLFVWDSTTIQIIIVVPKLISVH